MSAPALVMIAPGSGDPRVAQVTHCLRTELSALRPELIVRAAFLDRFPPAPFQVVEELAAAGVAEGARTGLASVVTGVLLLISMVFAPLVTVIPHEASAPALIIVGFVMMVQVRSIDWDDGEMALAAFLTIVLMPFTYSITAGIGAGFIAYALIKLVLGKSRDVHWLIYLVAGLFVVYFAQGALLGLLG